MKNYICNESGGWATSSAYIKFSLTRSIHFGRVYTSGTNSGREEDLYEALRCLGSVIPSYLLKQLMFSRQSLHTLEDFSAHSNYTELALREMGYNNVFPHVGSATEVTVRGKRIYPLTTGTFGGLDFVVSVLWVIRYGRAPEQILTSCKRGSRRSCCAIRSRWGQHSVGTLWLTLKLLANNTHKDYMMQLYRISEVEDLPALMVLPMCSQRFLAQVTSFNKLNSCKEMQMLKNPTIQTEQPIRTLIPSRLLQAPLVAHRLLISRVWIWIQQHWWKDCILFWFFSKI